MEYLIIALKLIVGLSVLNVWLFRAQKSTPYRGGDASNITEEFQAYGLPVWFMYVIGVLKVLFSLGLLVSIFIDYSPIEAISAYGMGLLMLGAVSMHIKIKDPFKKALPSLTFLILSVIIGLL